MSYGTIWIKLDDNQIDLIHKDHRLQFAVLFKSHTNNILNAANVEGFYLSKDIHQVKSVSKPTSNFQFCMPSAVTSFLLSIIVLDYNDEVQFKFNTSLIKRSDTSSNSFELSIMVNSVYCKLSDTVETYDYSILVTHDTLLGSLNRMYSAPRLINIINLKVTKFTVRELFETIMRAVDYYDVLHMTIFDYAELG